MLQCCQPHKLQRSQAQSSLAQNLSSSRSLKPKCSQALRLQRSHTPKLSSSKALKFQSSQSRKHSSSRALKHQSNQALKLQTYIKITCTTSKVLSVGIHSVFRKGYGRTITISGMSSGNNDASRYHTTNVFIWQKFADFSKATTPGFAIKATFFL